MKNGKGIEFEITQEDYQQNLREGADPEHAPLPGKYVGRRGSLLAQQRKPVPKQQRINLMLDDDVIEYFKRQAAAPNAAPYETQINNALRRVMEANINPDFLEALLENKAFIKRLAAEVKALLK